MQSITHQLPDVLKSLKGIQAIPLAKVNDHARPGTCVYVQHVTEKTGVRYLSGWLHDLREGRCRVRLARSGRMPWFNVDQVFAVLAS